MQTRNPILRRQSQAVGFHEPTGAAVGGAPTSGGTGSPTPESLQQMFDAPPAPGALTIGDVIVKTGILFVLLLITAVIGWQAIGTPLGWIVAAGAIVGLILGFVNALKREVSPPLVMAYALAQGLFIGGISKLYNDTYAASGEYDGTPIVQQAVLGTLVAFAVMLVLYRTRIIKVTGRFMKIMMVAMISYLVIALISLVAQLFGVGGGWGFYGVGGLGILLCMAGVALASLSLALDFEAITQSIAAGLPERESWRMGFALMVTLIWLYLEILRLLAILNRR